MIIIVRVGDYFDEVVALRKPEEKGIIWVLKNWIVEGRTKLFLALRMALGKAHV